MSQRNGRARRIMIAAGFAAFLVAAIVTVVAVKNGGSSDAGSTSGTEIDPRVFRTAYVYERSGVSLDEVDEEYRSLALRDQQWEREGQFLPISSGVDSLAAAWRASLRDPSGVLTEAQTTALVRKIAEHARARAQRTPDAYVALVESDPHLEWNETDPVEPERLDTRRKNLHVGVFYRLFLEQPYDPEKDLRAMLDEVWDGLDRYDHLFDEVGVGERGVEILALNARAPGELRLFGMTGKHTLRDPDYWKTVAGRYGMQFVRPVRTGEELLAERPSLTIAFAHVLVRMKDGRLLDWKTRWHIDPDSGAWALDVAQASACKTAMTVW